MKLLFITLIILISGCTDASKRILKAELTGEKYTIYTASGGSYKVDKYILSYDESVIHFTYDGSRYRSNAYTVRTTKAED